MMTPSSQSKAFTIVELAIVIVVVGILAAIVLVAYPGIQKRAADTQIQGDLRQAAMRLDAYKANMGGYPATQTEVDNGKGLPKSSVDVAYSYTATLGKYCLSAVSGKSGKTFKISSGSTEISEGECEVGCGIGFIQVPGNSSLGTTDFCVMKYEAKNVSGVATSQAAGLPWTNLSQAAATMLATNACDGCHLLTDPEWMTIAGNLLSVPSNWSDGSVGSGYIYAGHSEHSPSESLIASSNDNDGYSGTGNSSPSIQRRTLTLTNGEVIWDFAGNVEEWVNATITGTQPEGSIVSCPPPFCQEGWRDYSWASWGNLPASSRPAAVGAGAWDGSNGIGRVYSTNNATGTYGYTRGGTWNSQYDSAGVLSLAFKPQATTTNTLGFRVAK